jgi:cytochrome c553
MKTLTVLALMGLPFSGLAVGAAQAADAAAGRQKITTCQACHGLDGLSKNPEAPNLAGQIEPYLVKSLAQYRSGDRKHEAMNIVAKDLSDEDIADVAAYYASIQVDVLPP